MSKKVASATDNRIERFHAAEPDVHRAVALLETLGLLLHDCEMDILPSSLLGQILAQYRVAMETLRPAAEELYGSDEAQS